MCACRAAKQRAQAAAQTTASSARHATQPVSNAYRHLQSSDAALMAEFVADPNKRKGLWSLRQAVQAVQGMFLHSSAVSLTACDLCVASLHLHKS